MSPQVHATPIHCDEDTSKLGLLVGFGGITMLFITFMATFGSMVAKELSYIKLDGMSQVVTVGIASLLIISSLLFESSYRGWRLRQSTDSPHFMMASFLAGLIFLFGQITLWQMLVEKGLTSHNNVLAGMVYLMAGAHAFHLITGLTLVAWLWFKMKMKKSIKPLRFRLIGWYWHFLTALWVMMLSAILILINT